MELLKKEDEIKNHFHFNILDPVNEEEQGNLIAIVGYVSLLADIVKDKHRMNHLIDFIPRWQKQAEVKRVDAKLNPSRFDNHTR